MLTAILDRPARLVVDRLVEHIAEVDAQIPDEFRPLCRHETECDCCWDDEGDE